MPIAFKILSILYHVVRFFHRKVGVIYVYFECKAKARRFNKHLKTTAKRKLQPQEITRYRNKWKRVSRFVSPVYLDAVSQTFGYADENVVPWNIYFSHIEPKLNNISFALVMEDKSQLDWLYGDLVPRIFFRNIHGVFFINKKAVQSNEEIDLSKLLGDQEKVVVKQSVDAHGGISVQVFTRKNGGFYNARNQLLTIDFLRDAYRVNYVIQEYIYQHDYFAQFNPSSLNTLRVMTYRSVLDNEIHVISTMLRVGSFGSIVDNLKLGGYALGITESGHLRGFGFDEKGNKMESFGEMKKSFKEVDPVHCIHQVWETAKKAAALHYHARVLGFDMAVDRDEHVRMIEVNTSDLAIDSIQHVNGPLFHRFTDEVIEYGMEH